MDRRQSLRLLGQGLLLSSAACWSSPSLAGKKQDKRPLGLLVPLTGPRAVLGHSMQEAALLAKIAAKDNDGELLVLDTAGTPAGAAEAARQALAKGAGIVLGPLFSDEAAAAAAQIGGKVPVVAFTNNIGAKLSGAHVFGITPSQSTTAVLRYARTRGVRDLLVIGDGADWSNAVRAAALNSQGELGMDVRALDVRDGQPLPDAGQVPAAVLIPGGGPELLAAAKNLRGLGVQLLATMQGLDYRPVALEALDGAWLSSVDPESFADFSSAYEARSGGNPGAIAALAYDATMIAEKLRAADRLDRAGLLDPAGFDCITGPVRFRTDGSCARQFAIVVAGPDGYEKVAVSQGT